MPVAVSTNYDFDIVNNKTFNPTIVLFIYDLAIKLVTTEVSQKRIFLHNRYATIFKLNSFTTC
jgi:hypothetical protein